MSENRMSSADAIDKEILSDLANGVKVETTDKYDSKMSWNELTDRLGQLCQLMHCCPFGSATYIELRDEHDRLEKDLREGNYK